MVERKGLVTFKGNGMTLVGNEIKTGQKVPDFAVKANDGTAFKFSSIRGHPCVIVSILSVDTGICDAEMKRFNEEAVKLGNTIKILVISMDLPYSQKRWCGAAGVSNVQLYSDHQEASFGHAFGVLMKENRCLARTIFVVDKSGKLTYSQIVPEIAQAPNYDEALKAVKAVL